MCVLIVFRYWTTTGSRVFNLAVQGVTVLPNFDIVARVGGAFKAYNITLNVTVPPTNPFITITTTNIADNALIAGIILTPPSVLSPPALLPAVTVIAIESSTGLGSSTAATSSSNSTSSSSTAGEQTVNKNSALGAYATSVLFIVAASASIGAALLV